MGENKPDDTSAGLFVIVAAVLGMIGFAFPPILIGVLVIALVIWMLHASKKER